MKILLSLYILMIFSFAGSAQQGYKIKYESLSYDFQQNEFYKSEYSHVTIFNDSFFIAIPINGKETDIKNLLFMVGIQKTMIDFIPWLSINGIIFQNLFTRGHLIKRL